MAQITTTEAAQRLGVTDRRVRQLIEEGALKGEKIGRDYLVDEESVEAAKKRPKPGRPSKEKAKNISNKDAAKTATKKSSKK